MAIHRFFFSLTSRTARCELVGATLDGFICVSVGDTPDGEHYKVCITRCNWAPTRGKKLRRDKKHFSLTYLSNNMRQLSSPKLGDIKNY